MTTVTHQQIAEATGRTKRAIEQRAGREKWPFTESSVRGGKVRHYDRKDLPADIQAKLVLQEAAAGAAAGSGLAITAAVENKVQQRTAEESLQDLMRLTGAKRERAEATLDILTALDRFIDLAQLPLTHALEQFCKAYNQGTRDGVPAKAAEIFPTISAATVRRWRGHLKAAGIKRLAGAYGNRKGQSKIETQEELLKFCVAMVTQYPHTNGTKLLQSIKARFARKSIEIPGERSVQRWLNAWKEENKQLLTAIANPDAFKSKYMTAFGNASEGIDRLNQLWEADGTPADVELKDGRHAIVGVIDVWSRRGMLLVVPTQKSTAVAALLRRALLEWGVFETLKTDNGADYKSHHIQRVIELLGVKQVFSNPFSGWEKPHIERFFRSFSHDLVELLPTYIGHNVAERQELRARQSFADRLFKKGDVVPLNMTAAELQKFCNEWVANIYLHREHDGLAGKTPFERAASFTGDIRRIENERALDILLAPSVGDGIRTVTKKGIRIENGLYIAAELGEHVGSQVRVLDDDTDLGRKYVLTLDNEFICIAEDPLLTGVNRQEVAAVARERQKSRTQAARAELKAAARAQKVSGIAQEVLEHKKRLAEKLVQLPRPAAAYTSPGLDAAALAAEMADARGAPIPDQPPVDAAALAEVVELLRTEQQQQPSEEQRFRRWYALDLKRQAGEALTEFDEKWVNSYTRTAEFQSRKELLDDFGPESLGLEVMTG